MRRLLARCLILSTLLAQPVTAASVADGMTAFRAGDYAAALQIWRPLSEAGDMQATFYLSMMHAQGKGMPANHALGMEYLAAAARGGLAVAQFNLGNHYNTGKWVEQNPAMAAYWWRLAGEQGMPHAQHNLAGLYLIGRGVPRDEQQARFWYQRAARNGSQASASILAELDTQTSQTPSQTDAPVEEAGLTLGHDWLMQQSAEKYTLQVLASESRDAIDKLLQQHRLKRQVAVYRFSARGRQWYGLGYGRFDSAELARAAIAELPATLRAGSPWARRFGDIQALIK